MTRAILMMMLLLGLSSTAAAQQAYTEAELLAAVQQHMPARFTTLMKLKDENPEQYQRALKRIEQTMLENASRDETRRERIEALTARKVELLQRYDAARTEQAREAVRVEMVSLAREFLALRLAEKEDRLRTAQARVNRLQAEIDAQRADIDQRAEDFVDETLERRERR
ncbi:MAG: hypothetical protein AAFV53_11860 [Myxococcota bacterium]